MRIQDFGNMDQWHERRWFSAGSRGSWRCANGYTESGARLRTIYHYGSLMGTLYEYDGAWHFSPFSVGHGSVSDQQGMNAILRAARSPFRYRRDAKGGGARYESIA